MLGFTIAKQPYYYLWPKFSQHGAAADAHAWFATCACVGNANATRRVLRMPTIRSTLVWCARTVWFLLLLPCSCSELMSPSLPFTLPFRDYTRDGEHCADRAHVVFVPIKPAGSVAMRGIMPLSILNSTRGQLHRARVSYVTFAKTPTGSSSPEDRLEHHFSTYGRPSACVLIKEHLISAAKTCRRHGALVLLDCIDNDRCSSAHLTHDFKKYYHAVIVQTLFHAEWLAARGVRPLVQPHPHGDHKRRWVAHPMRDRLLSVGLVFGDANNLPDERGFEAICSACARANVTLYLIESPSSSTLRRPRLGCKPAMIRPSASPLSCTHGDASDDEGTLPTQPEERCSELLAGNRSTTEHAGAFRYRGNLTDVTGQHRFYDSAVNQRLKDLIDVGLLWPPGHRKDSSMAVANRPGTRMHWWWAQSIPVIAYPMPAYTEASQRINYPSSLVDLTTQADIERALCTIASRRSRTCLQRAVIRGAFLTSPLHAALELLTTVCVAADAAGLTLSRGAQNGGEQQLMTRALVKSGGR